MEVLGYLDRHLIYPVLDFYQNNGTISGDEATQAKFDLLKDTNMPGHCADLYNQIHKTDVAPEEFNQKQQKVDAQLIDLEAKSQKVLEVLENPEVASALRQDKAQNLVFLRDSHGINIEDINVLYSLGQFDYNRGNYSGAVDHLYHFRVLSTDQKLITAATWGKLASEILTANWEDASSELAKLREQIDAESEDAHLQMKNRTWLLHWALFPLHKSGAIKAVEIQDLFFNSAYLNVLQTNAPHLLRYVVIAVLSTSFGKSNPNGNSRRLKELVRLLESEKLFKDPIVEFACAIFLRYDFSVASGLYETITKLVQNDYFLCSSAEEITRILKTAIAESYLKLHRTTELEGLKAVLQMSSDGVVTLLEEQFEHLNLDIDSEDGIIEVMKLSQQTPLQDLVAKTKSLAQRSAATQNVLPRLVK